VAKAMVTIELNSKISKKEWQSYVEKHPKGLASHLPQWREVLVKSLHHRPYYLFARDERGRLCGLLPLFQIRSWLMGNRLVSIPFSPVCGPIADSPDIEISLVDAAKELNDKLKSRYLEIRMDKETDLKLTLNSYFYTYILELTDPQKTWKKFDAKSVRWAITKAKKEGVTIRKTSDLKDLGFFFKINLRTKKRLGVPGHPFIFFRNIFSEAERFTTLYIAELAGKPIAGIICFNFKDTVEYAYAASDKNSLKYHPNNLLVWQSIQDNYNQGYRYYDFGRTSPDDEGLSQFKKRWGTTQNKLYYYYYPKVPNLISMNRKGKMYRLMTGLWAKLPFPIVQLLNSIAFKHLD
jgi:serine/alanine adding enzyme